MAYNRKQRLNDNIKAIETAFILDREQRTPTARERLLLERYCGFGGLKCILNPARELADAVHWAKSDLELFAPTVELHRLIRENSKNESEYKQLMDSLKQSVLTAFYTPSAVTEALTDVLKEHQIIPEKVLEPSAGIGAFVDSVLDNNPKADIMAFEKDLLTGKILHHLHPEQKVRIEGFEKIEKPFNDYFDLAISNIPFGDVAVFDPSYTAMKGMRALVTRRIHNYFFVKALDTVRDGGLVAFITSQGVLNAKNNSAARFMMLYHADLVSAIRLPNNLFTENANTEVGSDLIILQKNTQKESLRGDDNLLDTVYNDENRIPTNNYFLEHPERIIHTTAKLDTDPFGKPAMIYTHEDGVEGIAEDLRKMLHEDFKKNLNLNRYLGIEGTMSEEVKEVEETEKIEKTEKMKPSIEEKQNDTVVSLQKQEKPTDDAELSQKSNHQQPPVQMTLFDLWGMEEENRLTVHATKKKAEITVGAVAKKVSRKKASPLVKSVNPTFEVVTKPVEKEEKPSLTDAKEQETAQETKPIHNTVDCPTLFWAAIPGNEGDFPSEESFHTFIEQSVCLFTEETNYMDSPSPFGIKMADRISGKPLHIDISDLPMRKGVTTNRNKFVLGPSGSGKSFFMNHLVRQYYEQGTHVVLVDTGNSYQGLCEIINRKTGGKDGIYYTYTDESPISFNPFFTEDKVFDIEKRESIKTLLLTLWKKDNEPATRAEEVALSNAVSLYIGKLKEESDIVPCFNTFYEFVGTEYRKVLEEKKVREKDFDIDGFLNVLEPYYKGGEYDYLLNSDKELDLLHKRFIVFEIDSIKDHPILFPVTTIIIMELFINKMRRLKGIRKMIVIEEAWKAIASANMASYIKYLYKTVRKFFGEAVVVTQEVEDIISSAIVKDSIINNSDCKILLDQRKFMNKFEQIQALLGLTEKEKSQILSINQSNDPSRLYKEVWIGLGGTQSAVYATEVSTQEYLAYTTEESEKLEVRALAEKLGGDMEAAIRQLAEDKQENK